MTRRVRSVVRKELRELRRDPITLWIAFVLPVVMLFLYGYAIRLDLTDVPIGVLDLDRTAESRAVIDGFANTGSFRIRYDGVSEREVQSLLERGVIRLAVVIPPGFSENLLRGETPELQTLVDGSFSATAAIARNEADAIVLSVARTFARPVPPGLRAGSTIAVRRVWYNPGLESRTFVVPGLFAAILMAFPPLLTVLAVVREKESGSVEQIYVSPLRPWEFIAGKMLPYVLIAFAELLIILALGLWWFRLPFRGSPVVLGVGAVLYVFCTVGIGLLVSTLTKSQVVALLLAMIVTLMPSLLFSGFMYPIFTMPETIQWYTRLFPARYFTDVSRGVVLKGVGLRELAEPMTLLLAYTAVIITAASLRFRKRIA